MALANRIYTSSITQSSSDSSSNYSSNNFTRILSGTSGIIPRYTLVKFLSDLASVAICGAADTPMGITLSTVTSGSSVSIAPLGMPEANRFIANSAVSVGSLLEVSSTSGRAQTLGGGVGIHHVVGRALNPASNANDILSGAPVYFLREI
jgi:hypothetical protein